MAINAVGRVFKRWRTIAIAAALGALAGLLLSWTITPVYRSTATLMTQDGAATVASLAAEPIVLDPVIADLGLVNDVDLVATGVSARVRPDGVLVDISFMDPNPDRAAAIANAIAKELVDLGAGVGSAANAGSSAGNGTEGAIGTSAESRAEAVITRTAAPAAVPFAPDRALMSFIGLVVGVLVGAGIAWWRTSRDRRVLTAAELAEATGARVLADLRASNARHRTETLRLLRQMLEAREPLTRPLVLVMAPVADGAPGWGTALDLAGAYSEAGDRVLVIDADLHLGPRMGHQPGLSDVLAGGAPLAEAVVDEGAGRPVVLTPGTPNPEGGALVHSQAMRSLLDTVSFAYDAIVVVAAPASMYADAAVLSGQATGTILVGSTAVGIDAAREGASSIVRAGGHLLGVLLDDPAG